MPLSSEDSSSPALGRDAAALLQSLPGIALLADASSGEILAASTEAQSQLGCSTAHRSRLEDLIPRGAAMRLLAARQGSVVARAEVKVANGAIVEWELVSRRIPVERHIILVTASAPSREDALVDYIIANQWFETCAALAGGLAHSFNNSLAAILGLSEIISLRLPEDSPVAAFPPKIASAVDKARSLVMRLSQMSRKAPGQANAEPTALILEELKPVLQAFLPANASLEAVISEDTPWSLIDRHAFEHILLNCIGFARGRMRRAGGSVRLSSGPGRPADSAEITVACAGPELQDVDADHLFELDLAPTETAYESGAGLFVAQRLAAANGATLEADVSGEGVTFRLSLPPAPETADP